MYTGEIFEAATVKQLFRDPLHPYTQGLLQALPRISRQTALPGSLRAISPRPAAGPSGHRPDYSVIPLGMQGCRGKSSLRPARAAQICRRALRPPPAFQRRWAQGEKRVDLAGFLWYTESTVGHGRISPYIRAVFLVSGPFPPVSRRPPEQAACRPTPGLPAGSSGPGGYSRHS